jgi:membrane associated rhomboid family serine protease
MRLPSITPVVKWLLIINFAVYFLQILGADRMLTTWFSVFPVSLMTTLQLWRFVTYQFLHGSITHVLFNMLGLFFLGPTLERHWGSRKFLKFYLGCGIAGGIAYPLLVGVKFLAIGPMIGASGAILGMLAACAILFPHFVVFILFFPVPIRIAAIIILFIATATIISRGPNAGGEAAHLGGMIAGALYVFSESKRVNWKLKSRSNQWEKKAKFQQNLQTQLDQILEKVYNKGIQSLTSKEKKILKQATKEEQTKK